MNANKAYVIKHCGIAIAMGIVAFALLQGLVSDMSCTLTDEFIENNTKKVVDDYYASCNSYKYIASIASYFFLVIPGFFTLLILKITINFGKKGKIILEKQNYRCLTCPRAITIDDAWIGEDDAYCETCGMEENRRGAE